MTPGAARRLAWALVGTATAFYGVGLALTLLAASSTPGGQNAFLPVIVALFAALGALIASRQPGNAIGWIFCAVAVLAGLGGLTAGYARYWLGGGSGPRLLGETAAVYTEVSWIGWVLVPVVFLLLLFPDGRLVSPRWRPIAWCAGIGVVADFLASVLTPGPVADFPQVMNPYGVEFPVVLELIAVALGIIGALGAAVSLVVRLRRARGVQRQQIKWLVYAGVVAAPTVVLGILTYDLLGEAWANAVIQAAVLSLPVAAGIAILRYRLYDIDLVINRTLVYGTLTATLAAAYLGSVLLLQVLLEPLTDRSDLAVAGSTLAVAALFRPARARIQAVVDRRFYRSRYDAARTLELFTVRLRDELDLGHLDADLRAVVLETVQPAHVSLWLPKAAR